MTTEQRAAIGAAAARARAAAVVELWAPRDMLAVPVAELGLEAWCAAVRAQVAAHEADDPEFYAPWRRVHVSVPAELPASLSRKRRRRGDPSAPLLVSYELTAGPLPPPPDDDLGEWFAAP